VSMITESGMLTPEALARWQSDPALRRRYSADLSKFHEAMLNEHIESSKSEGNSEMSATATADGNRPALPGHDSKFMRIVAEHMQRGLSKAEAMRAAATQHPESHQKWIAEVNRRA